MRDVGKINLIFFVKNFLYKYGIGFVFLNKGECNEKQFISLLNRRLKDNYKNSNI